MSTATEDIQKIVENSLLRADHIFEYPPVCMEISGNYENQIFATLGNFSTILAPPKVGKTTATGIIVSALLLGKQISNFVPLLPENKKVIAWIDTEQGAPECIKTIRAICSQTTGNKEQHPSNLIFSSLRGKGKEVSIMVIEYIIRNTPNIGFLVIDGIRDLVSSINDEREATYIAEKVLKWTQEANIHILTILHQNKGDANARGHLGTELMNKAETVVSLSRDDNNGKRITIIEPKFTRHKEFESFAFSIDDDGIVFGSEIKASYDKKQPTVEQLTHIELEEIVKDCFPEDNKNILYRFLWPEIKKSVFKAGFKYGDNKCKEILHRLQKEGFIRYEENLKYYSSNISV